MKNNHKTNRNYILLSVLSAVMLVMLAIALTIYFNVEVKKYTADNNKNTGVYDYHYAMIVSDNSDDFWNSVYLGAAKEAESLNALVELFGNDLNEDYTEAELMDIAISAGVDGIILEADGSNLINEKINKANDKGIPVVTLMHDSPLSSRISYVGMSSYNLGQDYAKQIIDVIKEKSLADTSKKEWLVMVLMDGTISDSSQNVLYVAIQEALNNSEELNADVELVSKTIKSSSNFETENIIRNIFFDKENLPDLFICLNETDSACVYQALVDYNQVGNIELVGYYISPNILSGISKNIIHSTVAVDTEKIGICGVDALTEYISTGYASEYYSIDTKVINNKNVDSYLGEDN